MTSAHTGRTTSESAINDYEKLLETGERSDIIINAGENKEFRAHSSILCVRSEYFRATIGLRKKTECLSLKN
ncbi:unnamed protein product [Rhizophagus irregularis]|nr:unnamed protein product [Rhizophagus irregularis]